MKFDEYFKLNEITINVSNGCNLACKYCFENNKSKQFMTQEQIKHILDKCYSNFTKNNPKNSKMLVSIFGGEPFLAWDTIEYALKYSREQKYNIEFGVTTNLTILTDHMIDIIEDYELGLLVSIDGLKEIHDKNRCNSYDLVTSNLKRLVERGLKYLIEVRMTVMPFGSDRLLESIQSIVDMGVVNIAPVPVSDTKWTQKDYDKLSKSINEVWDWLFEIYNDNENKKNISIKFVEDYLEQVLVMPNEEQTKVCLAGSNTNCSIGVNGDIMPCHQRHTVKNNYDKLIMGNIFNDDEIRDIDFNKSQTESEFNCKECSAYSVCRGGCPSENLSVNGHSNKMNKTQCQLTKIMVDVAIKNQFKLLNAKNIRSHRLNVLYQNLYILNFLIDEVLSYPIDSEKYNMSLIEFYEKLIDMESILLPSFRTTLDNIIKQLVNINKEIFNKV